MANSKQSNLWWLLLILVGGCAILVISRPSKNLIPWQTDFASASVQARSNHKLILLDFYADWCGPCKAMAADTWSNRSVADAVSSYVPVHINVDDNADLSRHYGVDGIPNILIVDGQGNVIAQHVGQMDPSEFMMWLHGVENRS